MSFIYITGAPGIGKSTIQKYLQDKGLQVYELDTPVFGGPHNKDSGKKVTIPPVSERDEDWFDRHEWRINRNAFEELKGESESKNVIICGVAESDSEVIDLFDKIIYLHTSDEAIKTRLQSRTNNDYGKNESELTDILDRKKRLDRKYSDLRVIKVDASESLESVVDNILAHINM